MRYALRIAPPSRPATSARHLALVLPHCEAPPPRQIPPSKTLIILSHGTGGSELAHASLAEALARQGYLVAALRHPGDNYQDRSLLQQSPARFLADRPQHAARVIDAILADPLCKDRIAQDSRGPRIGAIGHSAGGYTVLALAGAQPDVARITRHCQDERTDDPIFCGMVRPPAATAAAPADTTADPRVRAIVALAPLGVMLTAPSLARITIPGAEHHRVAYAWHYAFLDTPRTPIPSEDGDLRADPPGFDHPAFLQQLARELPAFFDKAFQ